MYLLDDFVQRPHAGLHRRLGHIQQLFAGIAPGAPGDRAPSRSETPRRGVCMGLVAVAHIHHVRVPLHGAGEGLKPDVVRAVVTAECDELPRLVYLAPLFHDLVRRLCAEHRCAHVLKRVMDEAVLSRDIGVHKRGHLQAVGGGAGHRVVLRVQRAQHRADGDGRSAAGAHSVTAVEASFLLQFLFQIVAHDCSPCFSHTSR